MYGNVYTVDEHVSTLAAVSVETECRFPINMKGSDGLEFAFIIYCTLNSSARL
jgi:hypothetical protein